MTILRRLPFLAAATLLSGLVGAGAIAACDSSSDGVHETPPDSSTGDTSAPPPPGTTDGGSDTGTLPDGAPPPDDCIVNPTTHLEIINACTDASKFDKSPTLPLLLADGGLPPLP
jgi:hypothetical protein